MHKNFDFQIACRPQVGTGLQFVPVTIIHIMASKQLDFRKEKNKYTGIVHSQLADHERATFNQALQTNLQAKNSLILHSLQIKAPRESKNV